MKHDKSSIPFAELKKSVISMHRKISQTEVCMFPKRYFVHLSVYSIVEKHSFPKR